MSYDPQLVYNPMATSIYAKVEKPTEKMNHQASTIEPTKGLTGEDRYHSIHTVFEFNLSKAYDDAEGIQNDDERRHATISRLAAYCLETGLPQAVATRQP